jgi:hypothetical protein
VGVVLYFDVASIILPYILGFDNASIGHLF